MFDVFIMKRIPLSRQEMVVLSMLLGYEEVKRDDFEKKGIKQVNLSVLVKSLNEKLLKAGINKKIVSINKLGKRYPHCRKLVDCE